MAHNQLLAQASQQFSLSGPGVVVTDNITATNVFQTFASNIIGVLTIVSVLYFIIQIIFAGYAFISSQGDAKIMETSRKRLTEAILGLFIVIVAVGLGSLVAQLLGIDNALDISNLFTILHL